MGYIEKFQRNNGLDDDGIIGPITMGKMMDVWKLSKTEISHLLGQLHHETAGFKYDRENLNYSATALLRVFGKYFENKQEADRYARKPMLIANRVYANRMGNGNESSGDGWRYRGRGSIQLTGYNNYKAFGDAHGINAHKDPSQILPEQYWKVALWYFEMRGVWKHCGEVRLKNIKEVTKLINGGYNGLKHRIQLTYRYHEISDRI